MAEVEPIDIMHVEMPTTPTVPTFRKLTRRISEISETAYCAGWLTDIEFLLWKILEDGQGSVGRFPVPQEWIIEMKNLSEKCGGWVRLDEKKGRVLVPLTRWKRIYSAWLKQACLTVSRT